MSTVIQKDSICFIDHRNFIKKIYKNTRVNGNSTCYVLSEKLFSIINENRRVNRKRGLDCDNIHSETVAVRQIFQEFICQSSTENKCIISEVNKSSITSDVRDLAKKLFESTVFDHAGLSGGNNCDEPLKCMIKDEYFLIPPKSRFLCGCINEQCKKLDGSKFDILIADPPWWNKFIRRLKNANEKLSYSMMYNEDIALIPIKNLLADDCLVAVWCTNAPSNINAVKNTIFPQWGVTYLTTWYWLKVTLDLEPICQFNSGSKKQPYERLILGKVGKVHVPQDMVIVSVPSALHSHKPPLLDLLSPYISVEQPQTLELFARYLLPNTTSVGYEPLKWQHISLYEQCNSHDNKDR